MMGNLISDPYGVEDGGSLRGMELLDIETIFQTQKYRQQVQGSICTIPGILQSLSGYPVNGYEIHMGETSVHTANPFTKREDGTYNGYCNPDGNVYGTYLHGILIQQKPLHIWCSSCSDKKV